MAKDRGCRCPMPLALAPMLVVATVCAALGFAFDALGGNSRTRAVVLDRALADELRVTRAATSLERAAVALERERESLGYADEVLRHRGRETVRRLDAYRVSRETRERQAHRRARSLYKLARGGVLRLVFEDLAGDESRDSAGETADRITRGRTLRWLVLHDLQELSVHRRAEDRARAELLAAARESAALDALSVISAMQSHALEGLDRGLDPTLASVHGERRRLERSRSSRAKDHGERRALRSAIEQERRALRRHRGFDLLEPDALVRPVKGKIVGEFGTYVDRLLRVPMQRNGVELEARRGEAVHALAAGEVAWLGSLPGFDEVVVVDHGGGYLSLTGRLTALAVQQGESVEAGTELGRAAAKGVDDGLGRTTYLELRHGERPIDPSPYLRRSRR